MEIEQRYEKQQIHPPAQQRRNRTALQDKDRDTGAKIAEE